jgi:RimJ/RimL family protein N-acetyltransferase
MYQIDNTLKLVPFTEDLITDKYISWFNDLETCEHTSHGIFPMTRSRAIEYVKDSNSPSSLTIVFAIMFFKGSMSRKEKDYTHVGNICLTSISYINSNAEIGIIIGDKSVRGKGIGTRVIKQVIDHAFKKLNLQRVWLGTSSLNIGMQHAAEKIGMKQEGVLKNALFTNGKYVDDIIYGITKYRFNRLQQKEGVEYSGDDRDN